ncbi:hypothetical protein SN15_10140 [Stenotrophomonas maltophilia]|nr:hypothetical protein SN15_10140 [Stenotrophomonas maltophilia]
MPVLSMDVRHAVEHEHQDVDHDHQHHRRFQAACHAATLGNAACCVPEVRERGIHGGQEG